MAYWLLLADPKSYSFHDLMHDKTTVWDGIAGSIAQRRLHNFKAGDEVLVYHTSPDKAVVGRARVLSSPYPDPGDATGKRVVVDLGAVAALKRPVPLAAMRENPRLAGMEFLKIQRIAVSPLSEAEFEEILGQ